MAVAAVLALDCAVATEPGAEVTPDRASCDKLDGAFCAGELGFVDEAGARRETALFNSLAPQTTFVIIGPYDVLRKSQKLGFPSVYAAFMQSGLLAQSVTQSEMLATGHAPICSPTLSVKHSMTKDESSIV